MLDQLTDRLTGVIKTLRGQARLTESNIQDTLREVRIALLEADVALPVVKHFIEEVKTKALGQSVMTSLTPGQALIAVVHEELTKLMGESSVGLSLLTQPPAVILMAGLQGSGKTTSSGKLAKWLKEQDKKKVLLVSCDVYRPAAIEQLKILAHSLEVDFFDSAASESPVAIAEKALDFARRHFFDVLIVDTAGRLAVDEVLMAEIKALHQSLNPIETLFVVDAMQGQDAVNTAKAFGEALPLTGIVVTKLDGDARGGVALSVKEVTQKPIKFIGTGEKLTGLEVFHPDRIASRILGMGDVLSLIEDAQRHVDHVEAEKLANKIKKGLDFDLEDFKAQLIQMKKAGGLSAMMDKLPAQLTKNIPQQGPVDDKAMNRIEGIINSMTQQERRFPAIIKASRKKRIAAGSGVSVQEVNRLLNQFEQMQKMMKMMSRGGLSKMMRGMKGMIPGLRG
ncbi:MAG: signal recognition particle protein [Ferrovum sp. 37-45-19]|uniref:signal recognition particle protein n=1 Tax=Ferrovum sp. JA12 TaxID=1356299 RepID=UPI000702EEB1|nr:signal recognition particle protein [Ferrovum sp. JA12]OYV80567.1 MAG: signal recognition particle protein [Ferrovum sp. 21-44-67]OYV94882.1 MAG: signal recognition particle protein [Ferrovum sp. 37-45-19]HQT80985.1 signal recognition particle protein [Ferrovaceae bacterium]KRH79290.1 signal recognition particle protein [Ferrovum sp. JA12]HQU06198.1 signal recognition particle protein [Ferrovaceae bacterium]